MSDDIGHKEAATQQRVVVLFTSSLGYRYLGDWHYRSNNANIEENILTSWLSQRGTDERLIQPAITELKRLAAIGGGTKLYEANKATYEALRYGLPTKHPDTGAIPTVDLIDWTNPEANDFAIAEEVTFRGHTTKRPDLVLYVNGIALVTIELKRSTVDITEGIAQSFGNQKAEYIQPFFSTVQLLMAGNDHAGIRYAPIDTPEKYWLAWSEASDQGFRLDGDLVNLCRKERLLELIADFTVFDKGVRKTCRHNQYFGVQAAQQRLTEGSGGIIWHTQGSGKSLTMVWLAKWILEHHPNCRVLLITDRTELDEQIEGVFAGVGEAAYRTSSGADLIGVLADAKHRLVCSLIHKFGATEEKEDAASSTFLRELKATVPKDFQVKGEFVVLVDEAHRTQAGKMHAAMKELLPGAIFIGFTGTPLLKSDRATSRETFGEYIHEYRFDEAVRDGVVLDLRYEARNIEQTLTSPKKVDEWFEAKTKGLTDLTRAELKKRWGNLQRVISSKPRAEKIAHDILVDLETKPRLANGTGNAILVCQSIYQACVFYEIFTNAGLQRRCAIVSSYRPNPGDVSKEDTGHGATEDLRQYQIYRQMLADHFHEPPDTAMNRTELFEKQVIDLFTGHPGQMRLLIVVDKLLTGFDAPPATYLYIDKPMRDHGLFQAICRVNRLHGEDKEYGYIIDYRDLFNSLESAITDYTRGAFDQFEEKDVAGLLKDRVASAREDLADALEHIRAVLEPVEPPKGPIQMQHWFVSTVAADASQIKANEPKRVQLYKAVTGVTRAFAAIANEMEAAGYSAREAASIRDEIARYVALRDEVKIGALENVDFRSYEADMRYLLDRFIDAKYSETISNFEDKGLVELIVQYGRGAVDRMPERLKKDPGAVAETIANNARKVIVDEHATNPKYFDRMSQLLDAILEEYRQGQLAYEAYLQQLLDLTTQLGTKQSDHRYPEWADTGGRRALVDNLPSAEIAKAVDEVIFLYKPDSWVGSTMKERQLRRKVAEALPEGYDGIDSLMELIKAQHEYR